MKSVTQQSSMRARTLEDLAPPLLVVRVSAEYLGEREQDEEETTAAEVARWWAALRVRPGARLLARPPPRACEQGGGGHPCPDPSPGTAVVHQECESVAMSRTPPQPALRAIGPSCPSGWAFASLRTPLTSRTF